MAWIINGIFEFILEKFQEMTAGIMSMIGGIISAFDPTLTYFNSMLGTERIEYWINIFKTIGILFMVIIVTVTFVKMGMGNYDEIKSTIPNTIARMLITVVLVMYSFSFINIIIDDI